MSTPLNMPITPSNKSSALRWLPFVIIAAAAVFLIAKWDSIPDRWIVHWNARGEPDGWASKTPIAVFLPIGFGLVMCAITEAIAFYVSRIRRPGLGHKASPEAVAAVAGATAWIVRIINLALALICAYLAVKLPLYPSSSPVPVIAFAFAMILIGLAAGVVRMKRVRDELRRTGNDDAFEGWNGLIYRNPKDERLWVPKLIGMGYTLNFAHPWAWPLFILIISIPLITVLIIFLLAR
ncbi:MAG TPA: DUF5808 domain-containing protein [Blastocatellia bacterium]|jgi:uncharacterized membrane protein